LVGMLHHHQADHRVTAAQPDADDALRRPAGVAHVFFVEPDGLTAAGAKDDVRLAVGDADGHQFVVVEQVDGHQPGGVDVAVLADGGALDETVARREHEEPVGVEALQRQHRLDVLVLDQRQDVADVVAPGGALEFRQVEDALAVDAAAVAEEQQVVVGAADQQHRVDVVVLALLGRHPATAAGLTAIAGQRGALDVPLARDRHYHRLLGDEVLLVEVLLHVDDLRAPGVTELLADDLELVADDAPQFRVGAEDELEARDLFLQLAVLLVDLLALEAGEALQAHVEDGLRLYLGKPELAHEPVARFRPVLRGADQRDDGVEVVERDEVALEDVRALAGFLEFVRGAFAGDVGAVLEEQRAHLPHRQQARGTVDDDVVVDREGRLELRVLVELVEHRLGAFTALVLEHDAHALTVGLVAQRRDVLDLLRPHQLRHRLDQRGLVHLVGDLGDDDRRATVALLDPGAAPDPDAAAARLERLPYPLAVHDAAGGEVGPV